MRWSTWWWDWGRTDVPPSPQRDAVSVLKQGATTTDVTRLTQNQDTGDKKHKGSALVEEPRLKKKKKLKLLRCELCAEEHHTASCALLNAPKPTAIFGGLAGEGLGFFHIAHDGAAKPVVPMRASATALVKVVQGSVPPELIKSELAHLIPIK